MFNTYIKYLILLIILTGYIFSKTITISGIILDLNTQNPIPNVNIIINNTKNGTTSKQDGSFILSLDNVLKKNIYLTIKMIGYEEKNIYIDAIKDFIDLKIIFLKNKPIQLETIEIHSHEDDSQQISDIIITGSELNENLKGNIASTLSNHPNIGINSFGSMTSKPALRGFSGDRFLLTKDGIETGDLSQSSIDHAIALDMTEVNKIEIIRGPKSLIYGSNAIGGVINTNLLGNPKVRFNTFHHRYLIGTESFNNSKYGNMMLYIPIKENQLNLFYSNKASDNEITPIGILNNTKSSINNYKLGFTNYTKNQYINFIIERLNMNYGIPPTSIGHIEGVDILLLKDSYQINYHQDIILNNFKQIDIKYNSIDYIHVELVNDDTKNYSIYEIIDSSLFHVALAKSTENIKIEFSSINSIIGLEYNRKKFSPDGFYLTPITDETLISIYGFNQRKISHLNMDLLSSFRLGYLSVNPGEYVYSNPNSNLVLKDEHGNIILDQDGNKISLVNDRNFKNLSFSFGIKKIWNKFEFNSWLMHTMRAPMVEELYSDGPHLASYAFEIGNPILKEERIYGIENSISFTTQPINFSLVTFYNYSPYYFEMTKDGHCEVPSDWKPWTTHPCYGEDWIDWGSGGLGWLHKYSSKGNEVIIKGFEFNVGYKIGKLQLKYNYSFVQGDNLTSQLPLSYINPTKQILHLDYHNKFIKYNIRFSNIHAQNRLGEFETYTPGAFLTDLILSFNYNLHHITIQLNNIFDQEYYNHLSRIKHITPEAGKNFHIIYKLIF